MHELDSFFVLVAMWAAWSVLGVLISNFSTFSAVVVWTCASALLVCLQTIFQNAYNAQIGYGEVPADEDESIDDSSDEDSSSSEEVSDHPNHVDEKASRVEDECSVCRENKKCFMVVPCGHVVACGACADKVELGRCPVCRRRGREWKRIFY